MFKTVIRTKKADVNNYMQKIAEERKVSKNIKTGTRHLPVLK